VDGVGALDLRVGVAGVEWRADAEAPLDPDDPRGLGGIALLVEDGPVDPRREPVDAAAIRALERNLEELVALGVLQTLGVLGRAVEIPEARRLREDDRQAKDEREIAEDAD